ncbi:MAG: hypothetical protein ACI8PZ_000122 [Myxococcota bacterium]|jgi:hypothetical protein
MLSPSIHERAREALAVSSQTPQSLGRYLRCSPEVAQRLLEELCREGAALDAGGVYIRLSSLSLRPQVLPASFGFDDDDDGPVTEMLWNRGKLSDEDVDDMPTEVLRVPLEAAMAFAMEDGGGPLDDTLDHMRGTADAASLLSAPTLNTADRIMAASAAWQPTPVTLAVAVSGAFVGGVVVAGAGLALWSSVF